MEGDLRQLRLPLTKYMLLLTRIVSQLNRNIEVKRLFKGFLYQSIPSTCLENEDVFQWLIKMMQECRLDPHNLGILKVFFEAHSSEIIEEICEFQHWMRTIHFLTTYSHLGNRKLDDILYSYPVKSDVNYKISKEAHQLSEDCRETKRNNPNVSLIQIEEMYNLAARRLQHIRDRCFITDDHFQFALEAIAFTDILMTEFAESLKRIDDVDLETKFGCKIDLVNEQ